MFWLMLIICGDGFYSSFWMLEHIYPQITHQAIVLIVLPKPPSIAWGRRDNQYSFGKERDLALVFLWLEFSFWVGYKDGPFLFKTYARIALRTWGLSIVMEWYGICVELSIYTNKHSSSFIDVTDAWPITQCHLPDVVPSWVPPLVRLVHSVP